MGDILEEGNGETDGENEGFDVVGLGFLAGAVVGQDLDVRTVEELGERIPRDLWEFVMSGCGSISVFWLLIDCWRLRSEGRGEEGLERFCWERLGVLFEKLRREILEEQETAFGVRIEGSRHGRELCMLPEELDGWYDAKQSFEVVAKEEIMRVLDLWTFAGAFEEVEDILCVELRKIAQNLRELEAANPYIPPKRKKPKPQKALVSQRPKKPAPPPPTPIRTHSGGISLALGAMTVKSIGSNVSLPPPSPIRTRQRASSKPPKTANPRPAIDPKFARAKTVLVRNFRHWRRWRLKEGSRYLRIRQKLRRLRGKRQLYQRARRLPVRWSVLRLIGCGELLNQGLELVGGMFHSLREFSLRGLAEIDAATVGLVVAHFPLVEELDLSGSVHAGKVELTMLFTHLVHLRTLEICGWSNLRGSDIADAASTVTINTTLPAVAPVLESAPHGTPFRLVMGQRATEAPSLRALNLSDCRNITDESIFPLGRLFPGLQDLCIFSDLKVTDRGVCGLATHDARLCRLNSAGAYKVTDGGSRFLFSEIPNLVLYSNPNQFNQLK